MPLVSLQQRWSIGIYAGESPFVLSSPADIANPVLTGRHVKDMQAAFVADPFMIRRAEGWYMFFEAMDATSGLGKIACARSDNLSSWHYDQVVLGESFHLSYPYVFDFNDDIFMVPETGTANAVRLYRAREFPSRWEFVCELLTGSPYVDSSLLYHNRHWWLFTVDNQIGDRLRLYQSNRIEGPWKEHPKSPIVISNPHIARGAGRILEYQGRLFRFAQDDYPRYGLRVWAFEIVALSETEYAEQLVMQRPILCGKHFGWNAHGMHHVDPHFSGRWIAAVDGYRYALSPGSRRL
jgi:hypothetical protein